MKSEELKKDDLSTDFLTIHCKIHRDFCKVIKICEKEYKELKGARRELLEKATKIHNRIHLSDKFTTKQKGIVSTFLKELKECEP